MGCIRIMGPEDTLFPAQLKGVHFHEYYISQQSSSISSYFVSKPSILTLNVRSPNPWHRGILSEKNRKSEPANETFASN